MTSSTDSAAGHPPAAEEKAKILVVDDLAENLLVYRTLLEELGQEVIVAHSGEEALKEVLRHDFAVILLDVNMPGLTGLETAAVIRTRKKSAHTPIIFLTAYTDELRVNEGYAHGAVDFIATPVVPAILRAKIKVFVDLFRLNQEIKRHAEERVAHAEERSRREAAEDANRRLSFLARAGAVIAKSLDRETTIESIVRPRIIEVSSEYVHKLSKRRRFPSLNPPAFHRVDLGSPAPAGLGRRGKRDAPTFHLLDGRAGRDYSG